MLAGLLACPRSLRALSPCVGSVGGISGLHDRDAWDWMVTAGEPDHLAAICEADLGISRAIAVESARQTLERGRLHTLKQLLEQLARACLGPSSLGNVTFDVIDPILWQRVGAVLGQELIVAIRHRLERRPSNILDDHLPWPTSPGPGSEGWSEPVVDAHVHYGAVAPTSLHWAMHMTCVVSSQAAKSGTGGASRVPETSVATVRNWLVEAKALRLMLARVTPGASSGLSLASAPSALGAEAADVWTSHAVDEWVVSEHRARLGSTLERHPAIECVDPIRGLSGTGACRPGLGFGCLIAHERQFLADCWAKLGEPVVRADRDQHRRFVAGFWRYVELRARFARRLTHQRGEGSLDRFTEEYAWSRRLNATSLTPRGASKQEDGLLAWWMRRQALARVDLRVSAAPPPIVPASVGRVVPVLAESRGRHGRHLDLSGEYKRQLEQADQFARRIRALCQSTHPYAAIDLQGRERHFHLARCRAALTEAAAKGLGLTLHVGEDFQDLLTGLRVIDEAIDEVERQKGLAWVRFSHVIAARFHPFAWYARRAPVHVSRWEHWLSLLWLARTLVRAHCGGLDTAGWGELRWHYLYDVWDGAPKDLSGVDSTDVNRSLPPAGPWAQQLVRFSPGNPLVGLIAVAQDVVRQRLCRANIIIEVCPTSNSLVSHAGESDVLRSEFAPDQPAVLRCVLGSDDPGPLGTDVRLEEAIVRQRHHDAGADLDAVNRRLLAARTVANGLP